MSTASDAWRAAMAKTRPPPSGGRCRLVPPSPSQLAGCWCGATWNVREPGAGCEHALAGGPQPPWPPDHGELVEVF